MKKSVLFITPPSHSHRTAEENLGIGYLASVLRGAGNCVEVIDGWLLNLSVDEIIERIKLLGPIDLIGISCYVSSLSDVQRLIKAIRATGLNVPIVAGGYGPTFHPEEFISIGCSYVLRGEAEGSILDLLKTITKGALVEGVGGLVYRDEARGVLRNQKVTPVQDLDALPFPGRDSMQAVLNLKNPVHISTSRGCMANCLFCSVVSFDREMRRSSPWRSRTIPNIVEEIYRLYHEFGVTCYKVVDDSFIEPPRDVEWAREFALELQKRNLAIHFRTQVRADRLRPDLVTALAEAGWFATSVGVENGSPKALKRMHKSATLEDNISALTMLRKQRIYVQMGMILFDQGTTIEELQENFCFLDSLEWPVTKGIFTEMYAAEGTPFAKLLSLQNRITSSELGNHRYRRNDLRVESVYRALKAWHKSHSQVYDHAINPISAPKVLPYTGYGEYHDVCMRLYRWDVDFFRGVLDVVEGSIGAIDDFVDGRIQTSLPIYNQALESLLVLDAKYGLSYVAQPNKFL